MRHVPRSASAPLLLTAFLAVFLGLPGQGPGPQLTPSDAYAEDGGEDGGNDGGNDGGDDLGDKHVPFAEQVNRAIEQGTYWLQGKPVFFAERKKQFATWGLVKGDKFYGGRTGKPYQHPAGPTALALYTMLKCDVSPKNPVIVKGFNWLRETHRIKPKWDGTDGTGMSWNHTKAASAYEISVMILALTAKYDHYKKTSRSRKAKKARKLKIRDKDDREWLIELSQGLIERRGYGGFIAHGAKEVTEATTAQKLGWRYNLPDLKLSGGGGRSKRTWGRPSIPGHLAAQDLSSTQFAAMALFSAQRFGVKVPVQVWKDILTLTLSHQEEEGPEYERHMPGHVSDRYGKKENIDHARGFMYIKGSPEGHEGKATGSMTGCGLTNLLIVREMIAKNKKARAWFMESGMLKKVDQAIWDGLAWLDVHWSSFRNTGAGNYHIYYLYCLERTMDILGKRLIGKRLWYPPGAKEILSRQKKAESTFFTKKGKQRTEASVFWNTKSSHDPKDVLDTCFALLYLKRATQGLAPPPPGVITGN